MLAALAWFDVACADEPAAYRDLFNGRDLAGWSIEGPPGGITHPDGRPVWSVRDGEIFCDGRSWSFLRYDREEFADFSLHVEFLMAADANSGVGLRCRAVDLARVQETRPSCWAYEIQLLEDAGDPPSPHSSGSLYRYVAPRENAMRPAGEWNVLDVTCRGPRIHVELNGREIQDFDQTTLAETRDKPLRGSVCLQNHGHPVRFRNVRIRDEAGESATNGSAAAVGTVESFETRRRTMIECRPGPTPVGISVDRHGNRLECGFDGEDRVNGDVVDYSHWPVMENPWMHQKQDGDLTIDDGTVKRDYDFRSWTVNDSPSDGRATRSPGP